MSDSIARTILGNPGKNEKQRRYDQRPEIKEKKKEYARKYNMEHKKDRRIKELKKRYKLTLDEYLKMLESQGGCCAICGTSDWGKKEPHVDHDHKTGRIRGILCSKCNTTIGLIDDDPRRAHFMAVYLGWYA